VEHQGSGAQGGLALTLVETEEGCLGELGREGHAWWWRWKGVEGVEGVEGRGWGGMGWDGIGCDEEWMHHPSRIDRAC
jgi:hypothetical protein